MATVPKIAMKAIGRMSSAPATPFCASCRRNADAVAAATIPRGASQAKKARSAGRRLDRHVHKATTSGRRTSTITTSASPPGSSRHTWDGSPMRSEHEHDCDQQPDHDPLKLDDPGEVEPVSARTPHTSCHLPTFVEEAADAVASLDLADVGRRGLGEWPCG